MINLLTAIALVFFSLNSALANGVAMPGEILFTQEVVALDADGNEYPAVKIDPGSVQGMRDHRYDMGKNGSLLIKTNIKDIAFRGLPGVVKTVRHAYRHIHTKTGRHPKSGVLLYIIEMDEIPPAYSFQASYPGDAGWSEVRLSLVRKGSLLFGPKASQNISELLFDTIPHELGHDVLADLHTLPHDLNNHFSYHTRWFIEGVCELLAKDFAREESAHYRKRYLEHRHIGRVLGDAEIRKALFNWSQYNDNDMQIESDLYGAAMLVLMEWTKSVNLQALLDRIERSPSPLLGFDLESLLEQTTGKSSEMILDQAHLLGRKLIKDNKLAAYLPR